ncbi:MAG: 5'-nucleotidase C-terminal domain-containing protein [Flavobacteriaceae bacterium]|nr:5'-nucleotidase C-terminal domain-containing protein [Flavobacteriaceae bacterium]
MISCTSPKKQLVETQTRLIPVNEKYQTDSLIDNYILPYRTSVDKEMSTIISYTPENLNSRDGKLESSLGNLLADLCYEQANPVFNKRTQEDIDFVLFNHGGIRASIGKGGITNRHAFQLMPFENMLVVVELTGEKVVEMVDYLNKSNRAHPLSKQVKLHLENDSIATFTINNKPFDRSKNYFVLTSDYLQKGGDKMNFFANPVSLHELDYKFRAAIIDYFVKTDTVKTRLDQRFKRIN